MNEDKESTSSPAKWTGNLALWLAVWAIIVSLICLYLAFSAQGKVKDAERRLQRYVEQLDESRTRVETLDQKVQEELTLNQESVRKISDSVAQNESRLRTNTQTLESTRQVAARLIDSLAEQKQALMNHASRLEELSQPPPPPPVIAEEESEPEETPAQEEIAETTEEAPEGPPTYRVRSGDTLSQIARNTGVSVPDLLDANPDINPNLIRVGQVLNLPEED